jgi:hypothetical protein
MAEAPKRLGFRTIIGSILAGSTLVGLLSWFGIQSAIDRRWAAAGDRISALQKALNERPQSRPLLAGEPLQGNAWDSYSEVMNAALDPRSEYVHHLEPYLRLFSQRAGKTIMDLLESRQTELLALRQGARCVVLGPLPRDLIRRTEPSGNSLLYIPLLAVCEARSHLEHKRLREAIEEALSVCQFARDMGALPFPKAAIFSARCFREVFVLMRDILVSKELSVEECSTLLAGLATLESGFPRDEDFMRAHCWSRAQRWISEPLEVVDQSIPGMRPVSWWEKRRFLFSSRALAADAVDFSTKWAESFKGLDDASWKKTQALYDAYLEEARGSGNPIVADECQSLNTDPLRFPRTQLRMMKLAAQFRLSGRVEEAADPFGDKLRFEIRGSHLKVWSVGLDGKDDEGVGEWDCYWEVPSGREIVLDVER